MNQVTRNYYSVSFGLPGDMPVPGIYDGFPKWEQAVFRPSDDTWHYNNGGNATFGWGLPDDIPAVATLPYPVLVQFGLCGGSTGC
jgi:hypothetical protein